MSERKAVIVAIGRSPVERAGKGKFAGLHPVELAAQTLEGVMKQIPQLNPENVGDVIVGCAQPQDAQGLNVARMIIQRAGFPDSISAQTVNRFCSSGLQAMAACANAILAGQEDIMIAGGVESMSFVDMNKNPAANSRDAWLEEHIPGSYMSMGITAENVAEEYGISRAEMEIFAAESHRRAAEAQDNGALQDYVIPIKVTDSEENEVLVEKDGGIRRGSTPEKMATLRPCFKENGRVTAATSSQVSDGAGFAVLMSEEKAKELGIRPIAEFVAFSTGGVPSRIMGMGPTKAVPKVLEKTGMSLDDIDVVELNEAFAAQAIPCMRLLRMDEVKVNPYGGAIALGHPMGATGIFLTCKVLSYLKRQHKTYGMVTMCIGGGMGAAGIIRNLDTTEDK